MSTRTVQVREFREGLAGFLREVEQGAEIVVMARNRPVARLIPPAPMGRRPLGLMRGSIKIAPDFDETPVGDDEQRLRYLLDTHVALWIWMTRRSSTPRSVAN